MIREAIDRVLTLAHKPREPFIEAPDGSKRRWLYNDEKQEYSEVQRIVVRALSVSNVESFGALVRDEMRRRGNETGDFGTVVFNTTGATFSPDDRQGLDLFRYERELAPQWRVLTKAVADGWTEHATFVRTLQKLRPSIHNYATVIREFRKVSFDEKTGVESAPILDKGKAGLEFSLQVSAKSGTTDTTLPAGFVGKCQFARNGEKSYDFNLEVDVALVEANGRKSLKFALLFPDQATLEEQAIHDEVAAFRIKVKELRQLLVLEDY